MTFTTCQCTSAASSSTTRVPSTEKVNFGRLRTCTSRFPQRRSSTSPTTSAVTSQRILGKQPRACYPDGRGWQLTKDEKELFDDYGLVGCHSSRSNALSVHARIDSLGYVRLSWESDDDRKGHAAIFEVKFGNKTKRAATGSRERTAEQLFDQLESVAFAVEGSDLGTTEDPFEPSARCINDTKKRQLVTRSGLPRLKCCVCHPHHKWGMKSLASVREFSKMVL